METGDGTAAKPYLTIQKAMDEHQLSEVCLLWLMLVHTNT